MLLLALLSIFIGGTLVLLSGILIVCRRCCEADRRHSRWVGRAVLCPQGWWHRVVLLRFAMARGCSDRPSPRRASDDPEKTTTTYLDDSQPAQGERWGSLPTCDAASWGGGWGKRVLGCPLFLVLMGSVRPPASVPAAAMQQCGEFMSCAAAGGGCWLTPPFPPRRYHYQSGGPRVPVGLQLPRCREREVPVLQLLQRAPRLLQRGCAV